MGSDSIGWLARLSVHVPVFPPTYIHIYPSVPIMRTLTLALLLLIAITSASALTCSVTTKNDCG
jgi:hypothetical protein